MQEFSVTNLKEILTDLNQVSQQALDMVKYIESNNSDLLKKMFSLESKLSIQSETIKNLKEKIMILGQKNQNTYQMFNCLLCGKEFEDTIAGLGFCVDCQPIFSKFKKGVVEKIGKRSVYYKGHWIDEWKLSEVKKMEKLRQVEKKKDNDLYPFRSVYEKTLYGILKKNLVGEPEINKLYDWLRNPNTGAMLQLDFYYSSLKLAIEVDGLHHSEPVYGEEQFEDVKNRDLIKEGLLKRHGVTLVRFGLNEIEDNFVAKTLRDLDLI